MTLVLTRRDVEALLGWDECIEAVEAAFKDDREAATFRDNARARGFNVVLERN